MHDLFSDKVRRNPFPTYDCVRSETPVLKAPPPFDLWMIFDYQGVKRALTDHAAFRSSVPGPRDWFIFFDPPRHTKLRRLLAKAFTPRVVAIPIHTSHSETAFTSAWAQRSPAWKPGSP